MRRVLALLLFALTQAALAQESDTAGFKDSGQTFTVLSEISDPAEKAAFLKTYSAGDAANRHALAVAFLQNYPRSWLLAQVFDIAARASIDLANFSQALSEGRFSLRLRPENPILLVLMANVEAQTGSLDEAATSARDALEYLDQFARPGNLSEADWSQAKPRLKSSAYFALGRSLAAQALRRSIPEQTKLAAAADALDHAIAWNPEDPEPFYLRALVELKQSKIAPAAADLNVAAQSAGALGSKARSQLEHLRVGDVPKPVINLQLRDEPRTPPTSDILQAGYAGSTACQSCHVREYVTWSQTGMARMLRAYRPENVIGDFTGASSLPAIRPGSDSRPYFDVRDDIGRWQRFHVDYTIGSKWQQAYATRLPDGTFQVFPIEYNALKKVWVNYWKIIDPQGSPRAVVTNFPRLGSETNYQENCAVCHTSQLRKSTESQAIFREPGIDCEMCHGPSALHAKNPLEPPLDFRKVDNRRGVQVCAQCHQQSAMRRMGAHGEMNYSTEGASFVPKSASRPYDAFSQRAFYKDGRFRETTFIVEAFTRSACFRQGTAQCATCHAPHVPDFAANQTSLKFKSNPNEMCLGCHQQFRSRLKAHTHHPANTEASECVSCHMPRIVNALLFKARSHEITIPSADLTERFGQEDSPNACLICHAKQDAGWVVQSLKQWNN